MVKKKEEKQTKVKEINIQVSEKAFDELTYMKVKLEVDNVQKMIINALVLQRYLLNEIDDGHKIIIRDESNKREKELLSLKLKR